MFSHESFFRTLDVLVSEQYLNKFLAANQETVYALMEPSDKSAISLAIEAIKAQSSGQPVKVDQINDPSKTTVKRTIRILIGFGFGLVRLRDTDSILSVEWNPEQEAALRDIKGTTARYEELKQEIQTLNPHLAEAREELRAILEKQRTSCRGSHGE
jgi:cell division protein FtsB